MIWPRWEDGEQTAKEVPLEHNGGRENSGIDGLWEWRKILDWSTRRVGGDYCARQTK